MLRKNIVVALVAEEHVFSIESHSKFDNKLNRLILRAIQVVWKCHIRVEIEM